MKMLLAHDPNKLLRLGLRKRRDHKHVVIIKLICHKSQSFITILPNHVKINNFAIYLSDFPAPFNRWPALWMSFLNKRSEMSSSLRRLTALLVLPLWDPLAVPFGVFAPVVVLLLLSWCTCWWNKACRGGGAVSCLPLALLRTPFAWTWVKPFVRIMPTSLVDKGFKIPLDPVFLSDFFIAKSSLENFSENAVQRRRKSFSSSWRAGSWWEWFEFWAMCFLDFLCFDRFMKIVKNK